MYTLELASRAAKVLAEHAHALEHLSELPREYRPKNRAQSYKVQSLWPSKLVGSVGGWKIAATSLAGQEHISVKGPLAGPILSNRFFTNGSNLSLSKNRMRVAGCEIVFIFGQTITPQSSLLSIEDAICTVSGVAPGIEVPDSRFLNFETAGEAQLIADCACSNDMVLGKVTGLDSAEVRALRNLKIIARLSDGSNFTGYGHNVMDDPLNALLWFVQEMGQAGITIHPGQFLTTGACVKPIPVHPGISVTADFEWLGQMHVNFT